MTAHNCTTFDPSCYRCELGRDEMTAPEPRDSATHPTTLTPTRSAVLGAAEGQETAAGRIWPGDFDQATRLVAENVQRNGDLYKSLGRNAYNALLTPTEFFEATLKTAKMLSALGASR